MTWVLKGGVKYWEGPTPEELERDRVRMTARPKKPKLGPVRDPYLIPRPLAICGDCGCALGHAEARCPSCLYWAEKDAAKATWDAAFIPWTEPFTLTDVA